MTSGLTERYFGREKHALTEEQAQKILAAVTPEWKAPVFMLALTGIRAGELLGLQWNDIDFLEKRISIRRAIWRKQVVTPKTEASKRKLVMPDLLIGVLAEHRKSALFKEPGDFVFAQADGTPLDPDSLREYGIYAAYRAAEVPIVKGASGCHTFRHLAASLINKKTGNLKIAQKQLGHSTLAITANTYAHLEDEELAQAATVLEGLVKTSCCRFVVEMGPTDSDPVNRQMIQEQLMPAKPIKKAGCDTGLRMSALVAGEGFEPSTFGL